ncbi:Uncharacterised protein g5535 [Pycnogonum litorale]
MLSLLFIVTSLFCTQEGLLLMTNKTTNDVRYELPLTYEISISLDASSWSTYQKLWAALAIFWAIILMILIVWLYYKCSTTSTSKQCLWTGEVAVLYPDIRPKLFVKTNGTISLPTVYLPFRSPRRIYHPPFSQTKPVYLRLAKRQTEPIEGGFLDVSKNRRISQIRTNRPRSSYRQSFSTRQHGRLSPISSAGEDSFTESSYRSTQVSSEKQLANYFHTKSKMVTEI